MDARFLSLGKLLRGHSVGAIQRKGTNLIHSRWGHVLVTLKVYGSRFCRVSIVFVKFELLVTLASNCRFVYMDGLL